MLYSSICGKAAWLMFTMCLHKPGCVFTLQTLTPPFKWKLLASLFGPHLGNAPKTWSLAQDSVVICECSVLLWFDAGMVGS